MKLRTLQGWALLINAVIGLVDILNIVNGGNMSLFIVDEVLALLFIFGLPAIGVVQPQTGRLGQIGLWCLGIAAGIAFAVMLVFHVSTVQVNTFIPLSSAIFFLVGSVVVGAVTIRAQVFPAAIGWLLIVGGCPEPGEWTDACWSDRDYPGSHRLVDAIGSHCWLWLDHHSQPLATTRPP